MGNVLREVEIVGDIHLAVLLVGYTSVNQEEIKSGLAATLSVVLNLRTVKEETKQHQRMSRKVSGNWP
jgi:hypothetical protein